MRARLDDAVAARDEARAAARAADEASVLAGGAVTRATRRAEELRTELDGAATLAEVDAALVMLTDLEAAERAAMAAFTAAGAARDAATAAEEALTAELGAADELLRATAASGCYKSNPIERFFRDIHQSRGHIANNSDTYARSHGAVMLGLPNADAFV